MLQDTDGDERYEAGLPLAHVGFSRGENHLDRARRVSAIESGRPRVASAQEKSKDNHRWVLRVSEEEIDFPVDVRATGWDPGRDMGATWFVPALARPTSCVAATFPVPHQIPACSCHIEIQHGIHEWWVEIHAFLRALVGCICLRCSFRERFRRSDSHRMRVTLSDASFCCYLNSFGVSSRDL
jgi:hypothetical protein